MTAIDGYDLVMIGILLTAAVLGYFKGIVWQLAWIAGIGVSSFVAIRFSVEAAPYFGEHEPWNRLLAMLALYAGSSVAVWLLFRLVSKAIDAIHLSSFDHQLGLLFGAAKGLLLCVVVTFFAVSLAPAYREQIVASRSGRVVAELLTKADAYLPPDLHDTVAPYLDRFEQQLKAAPDGQQPVASDGSTAESPLTTVWKGVQSVAAWAGVEPTTADSTMATEQGGPQATQAGGPLPAGSSWFAAPRPPATSGGMTTAPAAPNLIPTTNVPPGGYATGPMAPAMPPVAAPAAMPQTTASGMPLNAPMTAPPSAPVMQPPAAAPGGYRVGTQSPLPQRW